MEDAKQSGFKPPPEFQEDARAPLIEPSSADSTELWLIQWPKDQIPDFDGQQLMLGLHHNHGQLGTVEGSSGKSYDVVSLATQEPKATVFLSAAADSKIAGTSPIHSPQMKRKISPSALSPPQSHKSAT